MLPQPPSGCNCSLFDSLVCLCRTNLFFYEGGSTYDKQNRPWFFSWTFCIAACTIISGCLAERTALAAYPVATLLISGVVHPLLVHWLWSPSGWMSHLGECQVLDFAGELPMKQRQCCVQCTSQAVQLGAVR